VASDFLKSEYRYHQLYEIDVYVLTTYLSNRIALQSIKYCHILCNSTDLQDTYQTNTTLCWRTTVSSN